MGWQITTPLLLTTQNLIPDSGMWFDGVDVLSPPLLQVQEIATKTCVPNLGMLVVNRCSFDGGAICYLILFKCFPDK